VLIRSNSKATEQAQTSSSVLGSIRSLVSKKKVRYQEDGFDLDLTYITQNIVAMGFPSEGLEGAYRNPMPEVQRFFDSRHPDSYRVYNLCSERQYEASKFHNRAVRYPFDDHNCPRFELIHQLCQDATEFLLSYQQFQSSLPDLSEEDTSITVMPPSPASANSDFTGRPLCQQQSVDPRSVTPVVVIHCKAGKGRTGLMICCLMLYLKMFGTAQEALDFYGRQRTSNGKGVTIPSQIRYVHMYEQYLRRLERGIDFSDPSASARDMNTAPYLLLHHVRMHGVPNFDVGGGCDPYFKINSVTGRRLYDFRSHNTVNAFKREVFVDIDCDAVVSGDVKLMFYDADTMGADDKMFTCWVNTSYVPERPGQGGAASKEYCLVLEADQLDGPHKDTKFKNFPKGFRVELHFRSTDRRELGDGDASEDEVEEEKPNDD
jgi:phosphatidylinositol-3,4,5-trisphosphate 3-phosphatase/dual-specificity protein phosphatase PTEN